MKPYLPVAQPILFIVSVIPRFYILGCWPKFKVHNQKIPKETFREAVFRLMDKHPVE